jgi:Macrocin-O-methyltransferase (TylF)
VIKLPDADLRFRYEEDFLLTCGPSRIGKILALSELYQKILTIPGAIVECGVFRGGSFTTWAMLRHLMESEHIRPLVGFDTFDSFPNASSHEDQRIVDHIEHTAGLACISADQLTQTLADRGIGLETNTTLVAGDVSETVPRFVEEHPELTVALLLIDTDLYEPAVACFRHIVPLISRGGVVIVDNFGVFPGETRAFREYAHANPNVRLNRTPRTGHLAHFIID